MPTTACPVNRSDFKIAVVVRYSNRFQPSCPPRSLQHRALSFCLNPRARIGARMALDTSTGVSVVHAPCSISKMWRSPPSFLRLPNEPCCQLFFRNIFYAQPRSGPCVAYLDAVIPYLHRPLSMNASMHPSYCRALPLFEAQISALSLQASD